MVAGKIFTAIGLMSGTSMDGIDVALIKTDGQNVIECGPSLTVPYADAFKDRLRRMLGPAGRAQAGAAAVERDLTLLHAEAVKRLLARSGLAAADIDLIGFHGHTVHHDPKNRITVQLGDGQVLADGLGIAVACDFRGGRGGALGAGVSCRLGARPSRSADPGRRAQHWRRGQCHLGGRS
jgi:anhydro-N-acetylmuramic acid kinase